MIFILTSQLWCIKLVFIVVACTLLSLLAEGSAKPDSGHSSDVHSRGSSVDQLQCQEKTDTLSPNYQAAADIQRSQSLNRGHKGIVLNTDWLKPATVSARGPQTRSGGWNTVCYLHLNCLSCMVTNCLMCKNHISVWELFVDLVCSTYLKVVKQICFMINSAFLAKTSHLCLYLPSVPLSFQCMTSVVRIAHSSSQSSQKPSCKNLVATSAWCRTNISVACARRILVGRSVTLVSTSISRAGVCMWWEHNLWRRNLVLWYVATRGKQNLFYVHCIPGSAISGRLALYPMHMDTLTCNTRAIHGTYTDKVGMQVENAHVMQEMHT